MYFYLFIIFM